MKRIRKYNPDKDKERSRKWRKNHPKYYTKYLKKYHKEWRDKKRAAGLCVRCGKNPSDNGTQHCVDCKIYAKTLISSTIKKIRVEDRPKAIEAINNINKKCAICKSTKHNGKGWHIDHCHATKKFRGILCQNCNMGLGQFKDDVKTLLLAIMYLEELSNV